MLTIREYCAADAASVGRLIAETYRTFNLDFATTAEQAEMLGPFQFADSSEPAHQMAIAEAIAAPIVLVAEDAGTIAGVLRGGRVDHKQRTVLQSLFVHGRYHRQGIGRQLVARFEQECQNQGVTVLKLASTLYAVPFYRALGYKRTTGLRTLHSFSGSGGAYQPMKKVLDTKRA
ncbi:MAG: GNAT family N-acetyltransferase [Ardenticatenaceae bacterium]|nr:GNAT family N-acetyltransferase [Ardenticatenaceae bacterium]MCB9443724.1 GNAT family N-acetyltransferase [Ardenticatenaceae bacterium]